MDDIDELIGEVAKRHRVVLDRSDPIFVTVTLNEIVLRRYLRGLPAADRRPLGEGGLQPWPLVGAVSAALVMFGSLCLAVGYELGRGRGAAAEWLGSGARGNTLLASWLLRVPAGWMAFVLLIPVAAWSVRWGHERARGAATRLDRAVGWGAMIGASVAGLACAGVLLLLA